MLLELIEYIVKRKKYWLAPIIAFLVLFGWIIIVAQSSAVGPFLYTIF